MGTKNMPCQLSAHALLIPMDAYQTVLAITPGNSGGRIMFSSERVLLFWKLLLVSAVLSQRQSPLCKHYFHYSPLATCWFVANQALCPVLRALCHSVTQTATHDYVFPTFIYLHDNWWPVNSVWFRFLFHLQDSTRQKQILSKPALVSPEIFRERLKETL